MMVYHHYGIAGIDYVVRPVRRIIRLSLNLKGSLIGLVQSNRVDKTFAPFVYKRDEFQCLIFIGIVSQD